MKRIIYGAYGYGNVGDEAILKALLEKYNEDDVTVFSGNPKETSNKYAIKAMKPSFIEILNNDVLTIGGGGIFFDKIIHYFLLVGSFAKAFGKKVEIDGVGVTPLQSGYKILLLKRLLNKADKIIVRDKYSKKLLQDYGIDNKIEIGEDPAEYLPMTCEKEIKSLYNKIGLNENKTIFVSLKHLLTKNKVSMDKRNNKNFILNWANLFDKLISENNNIIFLPMCYHKKESENDIIFAKKIQSQMKNKMRIININDPILIKGLLSKVDLLIGMRLHSLILANQLNNKKIIGISYDPKIISYADKKNIT